MYVLNRHIAHLTRTHAHTQMPKPTIHRNSIIFTFSIKSIWKRTLFACVSAMVAVLARLGNHSHVHGFTVYSWRKPLVQFSNFLYGGLVVVTKAATTTAPAKVFFHCWCCWRSTARISCRICTSENFADNMHTTHTLTSQWVIAQLLY